MPKRYTASPPPPSAPDDRILHLARRALRRRGGEPAAELMRLIQDCLRDPDHQFHNLALSQADEGEYQIISEAIDMGAVNYLHIDPDLGETVRVALFVITLNFLVEAEQARIFATRLPQALTVRLAQRMSEATDSEIILTPDLVQPLPADDWGPEALFRITRALAPARLRDPSLPEGPLFARSGQTWPLPAGSAQQSVALLFGVQVLREGPSLLEQDDLDAPVRTALDELAPELERAMGARLIQVGLPASAGAQIYKLKHLPMAFHLAARIMATIREDDLPPEQLVVGLESFIPDEDAALVDDLKAHAAAIARETDAADETGETAGLDDQADAEAPWTIHIGLQIRCMDHPEFGIAEAAPVPFGLDEHLVMEMAKDLIEQQGVTEVYLLDDPKTALTAAPEHLALLDSDAGGTFNA